MPSPSWLKAVSMRIECISLFEGSSATPHQSTKLACSVYHSINSLSVEHVVDIAPFVLVVLEVVVVDRLAGFPLYAEKEIASQSNSQ